MSIRTKFRAPISLCVLAGVTLLGCGEEGDALEGVADTDAQAESSSGMDPDDPSSGSTGGVSSGMEPEDEGSSSGAGDESSSSDGGDDESSGGTTGDLEPESGLDVDAYRITWTASESTVTRLHTARGDFSDATTLTPAGTDGVEMVSFGQRPKMHADGRTLGFIWGASLMTADVVTGETHTLTFDGVPIPRFSWAPSARELAWIDEDLRFRRGQWDGGDTSEVRNLAGDGLDTSAMQFAWGPQGDRFWVRSRPGGLADTIAWAVDADGSNYGVVAEALTSTVTHVTWTPPGEAMTLIGNLDGEQYGREMHLGERDGLEMISHGGGVSKSWTSADSARIMYLSDDGLFSLEADGSDRTLIDAGTPENPDLVQATMSDDGSLAAWMAEGALTIVQTTIHTPLQLEASGVDYRNVAFAPGGPRIAYIKEDGGQRSLWMVDGDGFHAMNHELPEGANVERFEWFQDGLMYTVVDADERPTLHHTALGETPLFIPTPTEWALRAYPSTDENLLVVRATDIDFENGRLCAFDVTDVTDRIALGCEDIHIDDAVSVFVTQSEG